MGIWKNAFELPGYAEITEEEKDFLRGLAAKINRKSMGLVTSLALESTRPLHNLGAQGLVFLSPVLAPVFTRAEMEKFAGLLENPRAVSFFIDRLDAAGPPIRPGGRSAGLAGQAERESDHVQKKS